MWLNNWVYFIRNLFELSQKLRIVQPTFFAYTFYPKMEVKNFRRFFHQWRANNAIQYWMCVEITDNIRISRDPQCKKKHLSLLKVITLNNYIRRASFMLSPTCMEQLMLHWTALLGGGVHMYYMYIQYSTQSLIANMGPFRLSISRDFMHDYWYFSGLGTNICHIDFNFAWQICCMACMLLFDGTILVMLSLPEVPQKNFALVSWSYFTSDENTKMTITSFFLSISLRRCDA